MFLIFIITILQTICTPNFVEIGKFYVFEVHSALNCLEIKNCPILTKFSVHIVWSMVVIKIKKKFDKIYFLDYFFSCPVHCALPHSEILWKILKFQNIYTWGVSKKLKVALGMFISLSKSENGGTCFTLMHCAQTKNILADEPSP